MQIPVSSFQFPVSGFQFLGVVRPVSTCSMSAVYNRVQNNVHGPHDLKMSSGSHQNLIKTHHVLPQSSSMVLAFDFPEAKASTIRFQFTTRRGADSNGLGKLGR